LVNEKGKDARINHYRLAGKTLIEDITKLDFSSEDGFGLPTEKTGQKSKRRT
jgi:hypothetical protein